MNENPINKILEKQKKEKAKINRIIFLAVIVFFSFVIIKVLTSSPKDKDVKNEMVSKSKNDVKGKSRKISQILDSISSSPNRKSISFDATSYSGLDFKFSKKWISDRYSDSYMYSEAERGETYLTANITVTSKSKNPMLHEFGLYYLDKDSSLVLVNPMLYRFFRWEDYGTYLGNYNDNSNDFAHRESVKFTLGVSVSDEILNKKLFILTNKEPNLTRNVKRFENPPVSYVGNSSLLSKINRDYEYLDNGYIKVSKLN